MRGEAAPAPLALQLIKGIFGISPIPVKLTETENFVVRVGDQHGVFIAGNAFSSLLVRLDKRKDLLAFILSRHHDFAREWAADDHNPASRLPTSQREISVHAFPALAGIRPTRLAKETTNVALDVFRKLEFEQVGLVPRFQIGHQRVVTKGTVTANQLWLFAWRQVVKGLQ